MAFEEQLPEWEAEGTQPPKTKRMEGWNPAEKPPASWFNWLFHRTYKALQELQQKAAEKVDVQVAQQIAQQAEQTAQQAVQTASQTAGALASHLNDNTQHVTQAEKNTWNNKVSKTGDSMTGDLTINNAFLRFIVPNTTSNYARGIMYLDKNGDLVGGVGFHGSLGIFDYMYIGLNEGWDGKGIRIKADGSFVYFDGVEKVVWHAGNAGPFYRGAGSPEGVVTAPPGALYQNTNGGQGTTLYYKATGTGNTGWRAIA